MIDWTKITKIERVTIDKIVTRAKQLGAKRNRLELEMDLQATHLSCPLDLKRLLNFPNPDFMHDVFGIQRHLNRLTGELQDCFLPRSAKTQTRRKS